VKSAIDPTAEVTVREARALLDEELARLPERLRAPLVLCYLEDATRDEAARRLGWSPATLKRRLDRGRKLLRARLTRRGVTLSVPLLAAATAAVPPLLASNTLTAATAFGTSATAPAGAVTARAVGLAEGMLRNVLALPVSIVAAFVLMLGIFTAGAVANLAGLLQPPAEKPETLGPVFARAQDGSARVAHVDREGVPLPAEAVARVGSGRLRFAGSLRGLIYSPDGKTIACISSDNTLRLWDADTGRLRRRVEAKGDWPFALLFRPDGKAVHLFGDGVFRSIDAATGKELRRLDLAGIGQVVDARFGPRGDVLAVGQSGGTVLLFDLNTGAEMRRLKSKDGRSPVVAFSPDGKTLALASRSRTVELFDAATGAARFELETPINNVHLLNFSPDGKKLLTVGFLEKTVILWDLTTRKELSRLDGEVVDYSPRGSAFSPDGKLVALGGGWTEVGLFEVATGKEVRRLPTWPTHYLGLAFSPDGRTLLVGSGGGAISQWDVETGKLRPASADPLPGIHGLRFTQGGKHLLGVSATHTKYDWKTGRLVRQYPSARTTMPYQSSLSPDGKQMSASRDDGQLVLLDANTGKEIRTLGVHPKYRGHTLFSPDGKKLFSAATDKIVRIWDVDAGKLLHELKGHTAPLMEQLEVSPDGRWLATGSARGDSDIRLWDVTTGRLVHRIPPRRGSASAIAFSPDSTELAIGGEPGRPNDRGEVSLVDVRTGREKRVFEGHKGRVWCVAFSPDGRSLATGSDDKTLRLWEVASGKERHRFEGHLSEVGSLAFSPDGSFLAASSSDAPVFVWDVYGTNGRTGPAAEKWSAADRQRLWEELASADAARAFQAVRRLVRSPGPAVALLRQRFRPAAAVDGEHVRQLLRELDGDKFADRQKANAELERLGDRIESFLRGAWQTDRPLESKRRLELLLGKLDDAGPDRLRWLRSLEVLQRAAGPEAVRLLEVLAGGAPESRQTREAAALQRRLRESILR
jgi:WD40 repeat protein